MGKEVLTAEEQLTADTLLLWMGREWAPSEQEHMAFLTVAMRVMGRERCSAAIHAGVDDADAVLSVPNIAAVLSLGAA